MADEHEEAPEVQELTDEDLDEVAGGENGVAMSGDLTQS